jgi:glycosyltransferase involved in cell wall biosynthesis
MAAGNAIVAHDNEYNRWVAGDAALYFGTREEASERITRVLADPALRARLGAASRARHREEFTWEHVAGQYESLLVRYVPTRSSRSA